MTTKNSANVIHLRAPDSAAIDLSRLADIAAQQMLAAFTRLRPKVLTASTRRRRTRKTERDWRDVRIRQFRKTFGKVLALQFDCRKCGGPVSEATGRRGMTSVSKGQ